MNTNPDEIKLALWLDDELTGEDRAAVDAWAGSEELAAREATRRWRSLMASSLPAAEEPPYPDFFNSRIQQAIRADEPAIAVRPAGFWKSWWTPVVACAGMVLAFWVGTKSPSVPEYDVSRAPKAIPVSPEVYTPESGVMAEWLPATKAAATVIVLNGVTAIPDATDFSQTVGVPVDREFDSTAEIPTRSSP